MADDKELFEGGELAGDGENGIGGEDTLADFEETFERLREIVGELEREDVKLGEMVTLFEEGVTLIKKCDGYLKEAKKRVGKYVEKTPDGKWVIKGMNADGEEDAGG